MVSHSSNVVEKKKDKIVLLLPVEIKGSGRFFSKVM